jgi:hypothetical protein
MKRLVITAAILASVLALATVAAGEDTQTVPLAQRRHGVFDLGPATPEHVRTFAVGRASRLLVDVRSESGPVAVALLDPLGVPRDPATFERFTIADADAPALGAAVLEPGHHVQAAIDAPAAGAWTLTLSLPAGGAPTIGSITIVATGGLGAAATTSRPYYPVGQPVTLALVAFDGSAPVAGADVRAGVYQTGNEGAPMMVTLRDDGDAPDTQAGDGVYTVAIDGLGAGHYLAEVVASVGPDRLVAGADFEVVAPSARFGTARADVGVDGNGDGLFDFVRLSFAVDVQAAGAYEVVAELRTAAGAAVRAGARATLPAGPGSVAVPFAAADLRQYLAADGPWLVRDVRLLRAPADPAEGDLLADRVDDFGTTAAYTLAQLQRPVTVILPGITENAIDDDGDGLFDLLAVTFQVDTRRSGTYTWTGDLRAPDGTVLGVASGQGFLGAGTSALAFTFPGQPIGASGLDGPYTVGNAAVYGPFGAAAVTDTVGLTRPYLAAQFEGGQVTFARLIDEVRNLVITGPGGIPRAQGIRTSLLHKAQNAAERAAAGQGQAAANILEAFVQEVRAQQGVHIAPEDADRLVMLAGQLIALL